jgi:hypothetical protein
MKKLLIITKSGLVLLLVSLLISFSACEEINDDLDDLLTSSELTNAEVVNGLKTALEAGTGFAASNASQEDGFFNNPLVDIRILLPPRLREVEQQIRSIDLLVINGNQVVDNFIRSINRGAENAATEAVPIFINAITELTFNDARSILQGDSTAATDFLRSRTSDSLAARFAPVIKTTLDTVGAADAYNAVLNGINTYNAVPLVQDINVQVNQLPPLEEYAANRAVEGLFKLVAIEEKKIREDPLGRAEEILRKVFGSLRNE